MTAAGETTRLRAATPIQSELLGKTLNLTAQFEAKLPVILLGRKDFFSVFKVNFDQRKSRFSLEAY